MAGMEQDGPAEGTSTDETTCATATLKRACTGRAFSSRPSVTGSEADGEYRSSRMRRRIRPRAAVPGGMEPFHGGGDRGCEG